MNVVKALSRNMRRLCLVILLVSVSSVGVIAGYAWQSATIPVEVKEPLEILDYPTAISLFPGETEEFSVTVHNMASVNYSVVLGFSLNDTMYQEEFVTFSNENYTVTPGKQSLTAWLKVSPEAPPDTFLLTVSVIRKGEQPLTVNPSPSPPSNSALSPSLVLLSAGARWAAPQGKSALYVNWKDNWELHHLTDGVDWDWGFEKSMDFWRSSIADALTQSGFKVTFAGDIPDNLDEYDLVVIFAYYAVEPRHEPLIREYIQNGGGLVTMAGTPAYFTTYSKIRSTGQIFRTPDGTFMDWFGCEYYLNTGGTARVIYDNPFGTQFSTKDTILYTSCMGYAAVTSLGDSAQAIATWSNYMQQGNALPIFAFTNEYGEGRAYYQAIIV